jgi:hypothetical protein
VLRSILAEVHPDGENVVRHDDRHVFLIVQACLLASLALSLTDS